MRRTSRRPCWWRRRRWATRLASLRASGRTAARSSRRSVVDARRTSRSVEAVRERCPLAGVGADPIQAAPDLAGDEAAQLLDARRLLVAAEPQLERGCVGVLGPLGPHRRGQQVGDVEGPQHAVEEVALGALDGADAGVALDGDDRQRGEGVGVVVAQGVEEGAEQVGGRLDGLGRGAGGDRLRRRPLQSLVRGGGGEAAVEGRWKSGRSSRRLTSVPASPARSTGRSTRSRCPTAVAASSSSTIETATPARRSSSTRASSMASTPSDEAPGRA